MCLKKYHVTLSPTEKSGLKGLVSCGKAGGMRIRNAMLLTALNESDGSARLSEEELALAFSVSSRTLYNLRRRFVEEGFEAALHGHPRTSSPTAPKMTGQLEAQLIATACNTAPQGYGRWSLRLLGSRLVELGYCESISRQTVRQTLKKNDLKPWRREYYMIPPDENADFVCQMEQVLDVYHRPYDPLHPVACIDESPTQLIGETRRPYIDRHGVKREDYEYRREGVASIFLAVEPLTGDQVAEARDSHTAKDYAIFMERVAAKYPEATTIAIVQDNLATHKASAFYQCCPPEKAKALVDKFRFVHTPKHGSWLNMAEIALNVLMKQCLNRRMPDKATMEEQIEAWLKGKDAKKKPIDWQFDITGARAKLKRLYPKF